MPPIIATLVGVATPGQAPVLWTLVGRLVAQVERARLICRRVAEELRRIPVAQIESSVWAG